MAQSLGAARSLPAEAGSHTDLNGLAALRACRAVARSAKAGGCRISRGGRSLSTAEKRPHPRHNRGSDANLDDVGRQEWIEAGAEGGAEATVNGACEPGEPEHAEGEHDGETGSHRDHRGDIAAVEPALRTGLYPFVPADLVKVCIAAGVMPGVWWLLGNRRGQA